MDILISNKELLQYTKLSKDINSIIIKYVNYTLENIDKIKQVSNVVYIKPHITLLDILILCKRYESDGFFLNFSNNNIDNTLIKQLNDKFVREIINGKIYYYFKRIYYNLNANYKNLLSIHEILDFYINGIIQ
jgi:hypothetical protein